MSAAPGAAFGVQHEVTTWVTFDIIRVVKNPKHFILPVIKSALASIILVPFLYIVGFLLIPGKLTIGWHGSNWCSTSLFTAKEVQQYLLFNGFWTGLCLSLFVLAVFLLSYKFGKKLERKRRLLLAASFSFIFLFVGCVIANANNIYLINSINNPYSCRD